MPIFAEVGFSPTEISTSLSLKAMDVVSKQVAEKGIAVHTQPDHLYLNRVKDNEPVITTSPLGFTIPIGEARLEDIFHGKYLRNLEDNNTRLQQFANCTLAYEDIEVISFNPGFRPILVHFPVRNPNIPPRQMRHESIPQEVKAVISALMVIDPWKFYDQETFDFKVDIHEEIRNHGISLATRHEDGSLHPNVFGIPEAVLRTFNLTDPELKQLGINPPLQNHNRLYCINAHLLRFVLSQDQLDRFHPVSVVEQKSSRQSFWSYG